MSRDVDEAAGRAMTTQLLAGGLGSEEQARILQHSCDRFRLIGDGRGQEIGNAKDESAGGRSPRFGAAQVIDARARRVGDRELVDEVMRTVEQRVKRER